MNVDAKTIDTKAITTFVAKSKEQIVVGTLMHIIPDTVVSLFAEGEILQVLFFAVLCSRSARGHLASAARRCLE